VSKALKILGKNIGKFLDQSQRRVAWLAKASGIDKSNIGKIMEGSVNPTLATIEALASAMEMEPGELISERNSEHQTQNNAGAFEQTLEFIRVKMPKLFAEYRSLSTMNSHLKTEISRIKFELEVLRLGIFRPLSADEFAELFLNSSISVRTTVVACLTLEFSLVDRITSDILGSKQGSSERKSDSGLTRSPINKTTEKSKIIKLYSGANIIRQAWAVACVTRQFDIIERLDRELKSRQTLPEYSKEHSVLQSNLGQ
jgi:transcriptional regulator with XRE-family HTH domain